MTKYIKCRKCGFVMRIEDDAEVCEYCERSLEGHSDKVTEKGWREYWIGVKGQPFKWNALKSSKQEDLLSAKMIDGGER